MRWVISENTDEDMTCIIISEKERRRRIWMQEKKSEKSVKAQNGPYLLNKFKRTGSVTLLLVLFMFCHIEQMHKIVSINS